MQDNILKFTLFKYFYNEFDYLIRFTYTQVPVIRNILRKIMFWKMYSSDFRHIDEIFVELKETLDRYDISLKNKYVLEVGPGNSIAMAINCLCHGASKYFMADKFPRILKTEKQTRNLLEQVTYFEEKYNRDINSFINKEEFEFNDAYLKYTQNSAEDLRDIPSSSIDILISISVLEHIKDVEKSFQEMKRVLKKGGIMYHGIDMRDHYNFNKPFKFLKYSDFTWNNLLTKEGFSFTNRLRIDDFEKILKKYDFEIVNINKSISEHDLFDKKILDEKFKDKDIEDLKVVGIKLLAKKD